MRAFLQRPAVRRLRVAFRWCRISLWLVLFLLVGAAAYLHMVGLPDFIKEPMLKRLQGAGVQAEFSNLQLGWARHPTIILENASFSHASEPLSPRLSARRAELALEWDALLHFRVEAHSLQVAQAELRVPVSETNSDALVLGNVIMDMRFFSNDIVRLDTCRGAFRGIQIDLIGEVTHAQELRSWRFPAGKKTGSLQARLQQFASVIEKIHFNGTPLLQIGAGADGRDMNSFHAELTFRAAAVQTPWGEANNLTIAAACARLRESSNSPFLQVEWFADSMKTPWARGGKFSCQASISHDANSNLDAIIRIDSSRLNARSNQFGAASLSWNGSATLASSNFAPLLAAGKLHIIDARAPWGDAGEISLEGHAAPNQSPVTPGTNWGFWKALVPWSFDCQTQLRNIRDKQTRLDYLDFSAHWRAPQVGIENLQGKLGDGIVKAGVNLDVGAREFRCDGATDIDPRSIAPLLKPAGQNWLAQFDWTTPPKVKAQLRVVLPPWENRPPDWASEMGSTLQIAGNFTVGPSSFDHAPVNSAEANVNYTNHTWHVSRLHAIRPDGDLYLDYTSAIQTGEYGYTVDSRVDPRAVLPLLPSRQQHVLDEITFKQPPQVHAQVWGRWNAPGHTGIAATVRATNFVARDEPVGTFNVDVNYTNSILAVRNLAVSNSQCQAWAPAAQVDIGTKIVTVTNTRGTMDPVLLQRLLRKNPPDWLKNIHFDTPPSVTVSGWFSLTNPLGVDLHFLVTGEHFSYVNLAADRATGNVDWTGPTVTLTNIVASAYNNGRLMGWVTFVSTPGSGSVFQSDFTARNVNLSSMVTGITGKTNHIEGRLDGDLYLNGPNSSDHSNLQGGGRIHVHDGLLWDIKIFGLLSPVLNLISPGWGHSRAREADASFKVTNGAVSTDDLYMRCTGFRINGRGAVDKDKRINARMEAIVSREAPLIGPLLSLAFTPLSKLFEYHVTGTLHDPVLEPLYIPRFVMFLLHPFKSERKDSHPPDSTAPNQAK